MTLIEQLLSKCDPRSPMETKFVLHIEPVIDSITKLGYSISNQHELESYRADFAFWSVDNRKLIVEIDGFEFHSTPEQLDHDRKRDRFFTLCGWRVVRFTGREVHQNGGACVEETILHLRQLSPLSLENKSLADAIARQVRKLDKKSAERFEKKLLARKLCEAELQASV